MSQRGVFITGGGGGQLVFTLEGNTGGKVPADGTGNINVVGTGEITVTGDAGDNTLTISSSGGGGIVTLDADTGSATGSTVTIAGGSGISTSATGSTLTVTATGGSGGIITIDGDTGSVTGSTIAINAQPNAGASLNFSGSGTTLTFNTTDTSGNVYIGTGCGEDSAPGGGNSGYGDNCLRSVSTGGGNNGYGQNCLYFLQDGSANVCYGTNSGANYVHENNNICIGYGVSGTTGDSGVTRIGLNGTSTAAFISGIDGVDLSTATLVTESGDQLGTTVLTAGTNITITPGAGTLTIDASGGGGSSVYFVSFMNGSVTNVTGDGATYMIPFNATTVNAGSAFNIGTGLFTAPTTGFYSFSANLYVQGLGNPLFTIGFSYFEVNSSAADYIFIDQNFFNIADGNGNLVTNGSLAIALTAGDTVSVWFSVIGATKTVGLAGAASVSQTSFSGFQVA